MAHVHLFKGRATNNIQDITADENKRKETLQVSGRQQTVSTYMEVVLVARHVTWDFSTIEFHLYKVGHGIFRHKGCVELPVASILYTARNSTVVNHYLQVS